MRDAVRVSGVVGPRHVIEEHEGIVRRDIQLAWIIGHRADSAADVFLIRLPGHPSRVEQRDEMAGGSLVIVGG